MDATLKINERIASIGQLIPEAVFERKRTKIERALRRRFRNPKYKYERIRGEEETTGGIGRVCDTGRASNIKHNGLRRQECGPPVAVA